MKKLLALILAVALLLPAAALADLPTVEDLDSLEYGDLLILNVMIQARLFQKAVLVDGVKVPPGEYVVGEDIPAGSYRIEITGGSGYYDIFESVGGRDIGGGLCGKTYSITELGKLTLEEGNVLKIANSTFVFFSYTGLFN